MPRAEEEAPSKANATVSQHQMSAYQVSNLLRSGQLSVKQLKEMGFKASQLREHGFRASQLRVAGGYDTSELVEGGFRASECKQIGISARRLLKAGYDARELKEASFSARHLHLAGCSAAALTDAGFSAPELAVGGFNAKHLRKVGFSLPALKAAGFDPSELLESGVSLEELRNAGFEWHSLMIYCGLDGAALRRVGYLRDEHELQRFFEEHPDKCRAAGIQLSELLQAGITDDVLKRNCGYATADIVKAAKLPSAGTLMMLGPGAPATRDDDGSGHRSALGQPTEHAAESDRKVLDRVLNGTPPGGSPTPRRAGR